MAALSVDPWRDGKVAPPPPPAAALPPPPPTICVVQSVSWFSDSAAWAPIDPCITAAAHRQQRSAVWPKWKPTLITCWINGGRERPRGGATVSWWTWTHRFFSRLNACFFSEEHASKDSVNSSCRASGAQTWIHIARFMALPLMPSSCTGDSWLSGGSGFSRAAQLLWRRTGVLSLFFFYVSFPEMSRRFINHHREYVYLSNGSSDCVYVTDESRVNNIWELIQDSHSSGGHLRNSQ